LHAPLRFQFPRVWRYGSHLCDDHGDDGDGDDDDDDDDDKSLL
jgi:hypothetical protein